MIRRVGLVVVLGLVVLGLFRLDDPHATPSPEPSPVVGDIVDDDAGTTTWYCAAAPEVAEGAEHQIVITALTDDVTARITGYGPDTGSAVAVSTPVAARSVHVVSLAEVGPGLGGATVEIEGGPATVAHRLIGSGVEDQSECTDEASDRWYFASANTELGAGEVDSTPRLWLLNPFPTDASVDVRVTFDNSVRIPSKLRGIIVPAGSSRMVDLNEPVPRRAQFAFSVEARGGRVVAELAQTVPGRGLRVQPGVPSAATSWILADSFGGANVTDQVHVYNPSSSPVVAMVSVIPNQVDPASFPEPFVLEIPARRFGTVDLGVEARVPPDSLRWIRVDTVDGPGVVVTQVETITGAGGDGTTGTRPAVAGGLGSSAGASAQATRWYVPFLTPATDSQPTVVVANPSTDAISVVTLTSLVGGTETVIADKIEIAPQQSLPIDVSAATSAGSIGVVVSSSTPVVVSGRTTSTARAEISFVPAIPDAAKVSALPPLGG